MSGEAVFLCLYGMLMFSGGACFAWLLDAMFNPKLKHDWKAIADAYERGEIPLRDETSEDRKDEP